jgi:hypothetical protein
MGKRSATHLVLRKMFFSEEKNQKTFIPSLAARLRLIPRRDAAGKMKVFLLLFLQKKKILPYPFSLALFLPS